MKILSKFVFLQLFPCFLGIAQNNPPSGIVPLIFQSEETIQITIRTNLYDLIVSNREEIYQPAKIIYNTGIRMDTLGLKIRIRGTFRKDTLNCDFPPLRLNFKRKEVMNTIFGPQDKFRLVTHCRTNDKQYIQYVFREYYIYKIYNILNPLSLKVRMALITYEDDRNRIAPLTQYGFILEDEEEFATRFNMQAINDKFSLDNVDKNNAQVMSIFQFMIGNTDWIVQFSKNLIFLKQEATSYCVPYDFDYCGIVKMNYTNILGYKSLSDPERKYKGNCYTREDLKVAFKYFKKSRKQINHLLMGSSLLNHESFVYMYNYISEFYSIISSERERRKYFFAYCDLK